MRRWPFAAIPRWRIDGEVPCTLRRVAMRTCHLGVVQSSVSAARSGYGVIDLRGHTFTPAKDTDLQRVLGLGRIANRLREGFTSSLATGSPGLDRGLFPLRLWRSAVLKKLLKGRSLIPQRFARHPNHRNRHVATGRFVDSKSCVAPISPD